MVKGGFGARISTVGEGSAGAVTKVIQSIFIMKHLVRTLIDSSAARCFGNRRRHELHPQTYFRVRVCVC